jgi:hypothetical protein
MVKSISLTIAASLLLACQNPLSNKATGGIDLDAATAGRDASIGCPVGVAALLGDSNYLSSQVALAALDGTVLSASFISSASAPTDGLAFALSGDVVLPWTAPASGSVVVIDRYGTNVITWIDPATARVRTQLSVGTGFESNPQDYIELDATRALVSRWGINGDPNQQPFDTGNDLLVIDTRTPSILSSIALPWDDNLPPRPSAFTRVGTSVVVVLQRLSDDFSTQGDAEIVRIDPAGLTIAQDLQLSGVSNCGRLMPRPNDTGFGLSCTGPLDLYGGSKDLSKSALVLFDVDSSGNLAEQTRIPASALTGEPLQAAFDFASESIALLITQTPLGGSSNNRLLAVDLATPTVTPLAEAQPGADGTGRGLAFGSVFCAHGCSPVCLLADAAQGLVRRFDLNEQPATELSSINVTPGIGLLPRQLAPFGAP